MIELFYWPTPNGHKIRIFLEEAALRYEVSPINIRQGDQFAEAFLRVSPNNKIPAIIDHAPAFGNTPLSLFESGVILQYLAEKTGTFLPSDPVGRINVMQWLFWQAGGLGPMAGQNAHFRIYAPEKIAYAIQRYENETARLYSVLNQQLSAREYIAGDYSIADMAAYPWVACHDVHGQNLAAFPHLSRWFTQIAGRPAVQRAYQLAEFIDSQTAMSPAQWQQLFAQNAATVSTASALPFAA